MDIPIFMHDVLAWNFKPPVFETKPQQTVFVNHKTPSLPAGDIVRQFEIIKANDKQIKLDLLTGFNKTPLTERGDPIVVIDPLVNTLATILAPLIGFSSEIATSLALTPIAAVTVAVIGALSPVNSVPISLIPVMGLMNFSSAIPIALLLNNSLLTPVLATISGSLLGSSVAGLIGSLPASLKTFLFDYPFFPIFGGLIGLLSGGLTSAGLGILAFVLALAALMLPFLSISSLATDSFLFLSSLLAIPFGAIGSILGVLVGLFLGALTLIILTIPNVMFSFTILPFFVSLGESIVAIPGAVIITILGAIFGNIVAYVINIIISAFYTFASIFALLGPFALITFILLTLISPGLTVVLPVYDSVASMLASSSLGSIVGLVALPSLFQENQFSFSGLNLPSAQILGSIPGVLLGILLSSLGAPSLTFGLNSLGFLNSLMGSELSSEIINILGSIALATTALLPLTFLASLVPTVLLPILTILFTTQFNPQNLPPLLPPEALAGIGNDIKRLFSSLDGIIGYRQHQNFKYFKQNWQLLIDGVLTANADLISLWLRAGLGFLLGIIPLWLTLVPMLLPLTSLLGLVSILPGAILGGVIAWSLGNLIGDISGGLSLISVNSGINSSLTAGEAAGFASFTNSVVSFVNFTLTKIVGQFSGAILITLILDGLSSLFNYSTDGLGALISLSSLNSVMFALLLPLFTVNIPFELSFAPGISSLYGLFSLSPSLIFWIGSRIGLTTSWGLSLTSVASNFLASWMTPVFIFIGTIATILFPFEASGLVGLFSLFDGVSSLPASLTASFLVNLPATLFASLITALNFLVSQSLIASFLPGASNASSFTSNNSTGSNLVNSLTYPLASLLGFLTSLFPLSLPLASLNLLSANSINVFNPLTFSWGILPMLISQILTGSLLLPVGLVSGGISGYVLGSLIGIPLTAVMASLLAIIPGIFMALLGIYLIPALEYLPNLFLDIKPSVPKSKTKPKAYIKPESQQSTKPKTKVVLPKKILSIKVINKTKTSIFGAVNPQISLSCIPVTIPVNKLASQIPTGIWSFT